MASFILENLLLLLISTDLFIIFYFLNTCKKQYSIQFFHLQLGETLYSLIGDPNCLGGKIDILGPKALGRTIGLCVSARDDESEMENDLKNSGCL